MRIFTNESKGTDLAEKVINLSKAHPVLQEAKLERRLPRLERMSNFYKEKTPDAPGGQKTMFIGFVSALIYSMNIIKQYQRLTRKLARLAEEADDKKNNT